MIPAFARYLFLLLVALPGLHPRPAIAADDPGPSVVIRLQQRFDDIRPECTDGSAAINCNGVLARYVREWSDPTFWNPSQKDIDRNGVSFIYLRADVGNEILPGGAGLIMREQGAPAEQPLAIRCVFPSDAASDIRPQSCASQQFPLPCHLSGVVDLPTWQAHFAEHGRRNACYFEPTAHWFQFNIEVREHFPNPSERRLWNEVVIAPWPQDVPEQLPLEALYYMDVPGYQNLEHARHMQDNFIRATGKFVPVVRVELTHPDQVFFYVPRDQSQPYLEGLGVSTE
ncbi:hypothetical protein V0R50_05610 [Pseudomonas sp. 148P]|uniref:Halovibrin HvnA n=1 Tax=Pseudomonas ulcerans TaxID=3115852 RepID=A0ABU7HMD8_9PSED|nr:MULTISPECIES: hypothetical protein [unclassified Pseudomonas]MEE1921749.1 hypothetical protein [Pseudomonas sp. 147P]MEE1932692.1 hypothetical protein [Pseudomonas sp. 148P]